MTACIDPLNLENHARGEGGQELAYRPDEDKGVKHVDAGTSDEERRKREAELLKQTDNSPRPEDPQEAPDDNAG